ncbi:hypothetical protein N7517_011411 [Penicillium concentricum]|uniref:Uncharacterized protein n=1 Tax=Penicillium concentricum TaxID=293559 RepID=A0A9W9UTH7_9EURO|nr:uncharacterized protein N7517_011411 [Penicillium concentricum]KAJ5356802.1 hypothetical protein N7517_011411 [Penicillium concentricum]
MPQDLWGTEDFVYRDTQHDPHLVLVLTVQSLPVHWEDQIQAEKKLGGKGFELNCSPGHGFYRAPNKGCRVFPWPRQDEDIIINNIDRNTNIIVDIKEAIYASSHGSNEGSCHLISSVLGRAGTFLIFCLFWE